MLKLIFKNQTALLLGLLLLLAACATKNDVKEKQAALYFAAGTQSLMAQSYTDALNSLLKADELDPNNSDILNNLAMAYYFKGQKDLAFKYLEQSLKVNPKNSDARVNLASIYFKENDLPRAEKLYHEVVKDLTYDKQARTLYNLGLIEIQKQNFARAEEYFKKSVTENENYCPSHFELGMLQFRKRQLNTALRSFKEATMGTCYDSPAPHYYQALILVQLRKFDEARVKISEVETRFKKSPFATKAIELGQEIQKLESRNIIEGNASYQKLQKADF